MSILSPRRLTTLTKGSEAGGTGPATPRGHRNSNSDWDFPFPLPGRWKGKKRIPANTERRTPWVDVDAIDATRIAPRYVKSPVPLEEVKRRVRAFADDVGVISIDDPAIAHERDEIRYVYPHARSLVVPDRRGEQGRDAVALSADRQPRALRVPKSGSSRWATGRCSYLNDARRRGADDDDRLAAGGAAALGGQDLAAQPQARRAGGRPRRDRHEPELPAPQASAPTA